MKKILLVALMLSMFGIVCGFAVELGDFLLSIPCAAKTLGGLYVMGVGVNMLNQPDYLFTHFTGTIYAVFGGLFALEGGALLVNLLVGFPDGIRVCRIINAVVDGGIALLLIESFPAFLVCAALFILDLVPFSVEAKTAPPASQAPAESGRGADPVFRLLSVTLRTSADSGRGAPPSLSPVLALHFRL
jgi:hypothetical protein